MAKTLIIEEPGFSCSLAKGYVEKNSTTPPKVPILCCEGSCLRGEIARRAANITAYRLLPETTVRICFQGIVAGGCGEGVLIERAEKVLFIEGCALKCSLRLVKGSMEIKAKIDVVVADQLYEFDRHLFGIDQIPEEEIKAHAEGVAKKIVENIRC